MRININKYYCIFVPKNINGAQVAGYIDTPLPSPIASKRMIVEYTMRGVFFKENKPFVELPLNLKRYFLIPFFKQSMKLCPHYELR